MGVSIERILIVDDHPMVRAGMACLISTQPDLEVCGEAGGVRAAMTAVRETDPDLVVVDLSLADGNGIELIKRLKVHYPSLKILVCSMHDESLFAERAINAGALGYVSKSETTGGVLDAMRQVLAGKIYLSAPMVERVINGFAKSGANGTGSVGGLSDRELEVFGLIGQGLSTSRIAERLHLSIKTVETHREKIKRKLQICTCGELVRHAVQWQLEQA
jgi:DNA-binding NarL/FixJ family response regulator